MSFFSVEHLTAGYGSSPVIKDISFDLDCGSLMGILGANGSGKTTLLKAICGILTHGGTCRLDGIQLERLSVRQTARLCSYIPQRSGISIDISALDVVLMGFNPQLGLLEHPSAKMQTAALQALAQVGLADRAHTNYLHLSEGQKQLCILARTLAAGSKLLLLDEPESALDFRHRHQTLSRLVRWIKQTQHSAIVTLHDPTLALNFCDSLLLLDQGQVAGVLHPRSDDISAMETLLGRIYGPVSLQYMTARTGKSQLIMLNEGDDL